MPTSTPTQLSRALREAPPRKATPLDLFQLAKHQWLAGERIDVGALAARLKIGRRCRTTRLMVSRLLPASTIG